MVLLAFPYGFNKNSQQREILEAFEVIKHIDVENIGIVITFCEKRNMIERY